MAKYFADRWANLDIQHEFRLSLDKVIQIVARMPRPLGSASVDVLSSHVTKTTGSLGMRLSSLTDLTGTLTTLNSAEAIVHSLPLVPDIDGKLQFHAVLQALVDRASTLPPFGETNDFIHLTGPVYSSINTPPLSHVKAAKQMQAAWRHRNKRKAAQAGLSSESLDTPAAPGSMQSTTGASKSRPPFSLPTVVIGQTDGDGVEEEGTTVIDEQSLTPPQPNPGPSLQDRITFLSRSIRPIMETSPSTSSINEVGLPGTVEGGLHSRNRTASRSHLTSTTKSSDEVVSIMPSGSKAIVVHDPSDTGEGVLVEAAMIDGDARITIPVGQVPTLPGMTASPSARH
jgi:hypothetical protein